jgi:hypothetical protein
MDAFSNGTVWNSDKSGKGYDVVLLGRLATARIDVVDAQRRIDRNAALAKSLADVNIASAIDLFATYATGAADLASWLGDTPPNSDFSLKLEYTSGLAYNLQIADRIYRAMVRARRYPDGLFSAPPDVEPTLRERILHPG